MGGATSNCDVCCTPQPDAMAKLEPIPALANSSPTSEARQQGDSRSFTFGKSESGSCMMQNQRASITAQLSVGAHSVSLPGTESSPARSFQAGKSVGFASNMDVVVTVAGDAPQGDLPDSKPLSLETVRYLVAMFSKIDKNGSNTITVDEAVAFWGNSVSDATAMFNEVDADGNGAITMEEFISFWQGVRNTGNTEENIIAEVNRQLKQAGSI